MSLSTTVRAVGVTATLTGDGQPVDLLALTGDTAALAPLADVAGGTLTAHTTVAVTADVMVCFTDGPAAPCGLDREAIHDIVCWGTAADKEPVDPAGTHRPTVTIPDGRTATVHIRIIVVN